MPRVVGIVSRSSLRGCAGGWSSSPRRCSRRLRRKDQRRWGEVYLRGLMLDGKRKSIEPMAARLADGDEQCLQQFVNQSPWEWEPVRARLARRMSAAIAPEAWIVDDTRLSEVRPLLGRGRASVLRGAGQGRQLPDRRVDQRRHRRRRGARSTGGCSCPRSGTTTGSGGRRRTLPDEIRHTAEVAAGAGDDRRAARLGARAAGDPRRRRLRRDHRVSASGSSSASSTTSCRSRARPAPTAEDVRARAARLRGQRASAEAALPRGALLARSARARGRHARRCDGHLARGHARQALARGSSRCGSARPTSSSAAPPATERAAARWLICEWPDGADEPVKYWLSNLPADTPLERLVSLAKLRWRIEHDYRELKDALGLDHFEGRTYRGWHHHVTLVSVAHALPHPGTAQPKSACAGLTLFAGRCASCNSSSPVGPAPAQPANDDCPAAPPTSTRYPSRPNGALLVTPPVAPALDILARVLQGVPGAPMTSISRPSGPAS